MQAILATVQRIAINGQRIDRSVGKISQQQLPCEFRDLTTAKNFTDGHCQTTKGCLVGDESRVVIVRDGVNKTGRRGPAGTFTLIPAKVAAVLG